MIIEFKIRVKTLEGRILTYNKVKEYSVSEGLIEFIDNKTGDKKIYPSSSCEIEPFKGENEGRR